MKKLLVVTFIAFFFMVGEIVGGYFSGSIAIITDAVHQFSDVAGFLMSFLAVYLGQRPSNHRMTFGYHRAEILGAIASILLIWGLIIYLFIEAVYRVSHPQPIDGMVMLITACCGLACNILSMLTLNYLGIEEIGGGSDDKKKVEDDEEAKKPRAALGEKEQKLNNQGSSMSFEKANH